MDLALMRMKNGVDLLRKINSLPMVPQALYGIGKLPCNPIKILFSMHPYQSHLFW